MVRLSPDCPECHHCVSWNVSVCHWANVIVRLSPSVQYVGSLTLPQGCWSDAGVVWNSADWIASIFVRTSRMVSSVIWHEVAYLNNTACKSAFPQACFWLHKWERDWCHQRVWGARLSSEPTFHSSAPRLK